jgi:phosphoribosylanthranilate isomerase
MAQASPIRTKICGITTREDAGLAIEAGADFLGLIFASYSPRCVTVEAAREIAFAVRDEATRLVGVFQDQELAEIQAVVERVPLDFIQLHGQEPSSLLGRLPLPVIRFAPLAEAALSVVRDLETDTDHKRIAALLLEPPKGSGLSLPGWLDAHPGGEAALRTISRTTPLFLAGGLTPDNIAAVLHRVRPFAVDVASGVEIYPGVPGQKDAGKLRAFCATIKESHSDFSGDPSLCNPLDFSGLSAAFTSPNR